VKRLAVLGSTGSIGTRVLAVAERHPERLEVVALSGGKNVDLLIQQAKQFRPALLSVERAQDVGRVREALGGVPTEVACGPEGLLAVAECGADLLVGALVGRLGLEPVLAAVRRGRDVALANKEVLVMAGALLLEEARRSGARVLPLDSEHVAIHQAMAGHPREAVRRVVLTASGGALRGASPREIAGASPEAALAHPNWDMGPKITVDSATLMNKGLEVIEARWMFGLRPDQIDVLIHPESIVHSLVEYVDGSWLAQLGVPDMRIPIAYVLGMPERLALPDVRPLDLGALGALHFEAPDRDRFPCLGLALEALRAGGTAPAALNGANEEAVRAFLAREIPLGGIAGAVRFALERIPTAEAPGLEEILNADVRARATARQWLEAHAL
jgi:1-deoxy-D-xylulose-5-phosphate reductoisomerase